MIKTPTEAQKHLADLWAIYMHFLIGEIELGRPYAPAQRLRWSIVSAIAASSGAWPASRGFSMYAPQQPDVLSAHALYMTVDADLAAAKCDFDLRSRLN